MKSAFSKINSDYAARFISYKEAIEILARDSGDTFSEIASTLRRFEICGKNGVRLTSKGGTFVEDGADFRLVLLLEDTIQTNAINVATDPTVELTADPELTGWWRLPFIFDLEISTGILAPEAWSRPIEQGAPSDQTLESMPSSNRSDLERRMALATERIRKLEIELQVANLKIQELSSGVSGSTIAPLHPTHLMKIAIEVQHKFWTDLQLPPKQEALIADLMEQYSLTGAEARAVERVACPISRKTKPQP